MNVVSVVGWALWGFVAFLAVTFTIGCRKYAASGQTFMWATGIQTLFWWLLAIAFLLGSESKLHLAWMIPVLFFVARWLAMDQIPLLSPLIKGVTRGFMAIALVGTRKPR